MLVCELLALFYVVIYFYNCPKVVDFVRDFFPLLTKCNAVLLTQTRLDLIMTFNRKSLLSDFNVKASVLVSFRL